MENREKDLATQDTVDILIRILDKVKTLDPVNSRKWFDDLVVLRFDGGILEVGCPDGAAAQFLHDKCLKTFTQAAQNVTGYLVAVKFSVSDSALAEPMQTCTRSTVKLHPDYTFASFVVGPCNRLAHASCVAVSHAPGNTYNPLFLYGSVGLGKTHLPHAVCHGVKKRSVDTQIQFLSCE